MRKFSIAAQRSRNADLLAGSIPAAASITARIYCRTDSTACVAGYSRKVTTRNPHPRSKYFTPRRSARIGSATCGSGRRTMTNSGRGSLISANYTKKVGAEVRPLMAKRELIMGSIATHASLLRSQTKWVLKKPNNHAQVHRPKDTSRSLTRAQPHWRNLSTDRGVLCW